MSGKLPDGGGRISQFLYLIILRFSPVRHMDGPDESSFAIKDRCRQQVEEKTKTSIVASVVAD